jgi:hypothetical protein
MAHCGYEPTAADAMMKHPLQALAIAWRGVKTKGPMAPEIPMQNQRPTQHVFDSIGQQKLSFAPTRRARRRLKRPTRRPARPKRFHHAPNRQDEKGPG